MLDAYIIEEIKRRERLPKEDEQPVIELPLPAEDPPQRRSDTQGEEKPKRGVVVIDLAV